MMNNSFQSKQDFKEAVLAIMEPLASLYQNSPAGYLHLGNSGTVYNKRRQEIEAFLRPLWGLSAPICEASQWREIYLNGIKEGTNPLSESYWGRVDDYDQIIVEMAPIAVMILLEKEGTWDTLSSIEQKNLSIWLLQINEKRIPKNNWTLFRVLINTAMKKVGMPYNEEQLLADFKLVDSFYLGNGWYCDGKETQVDYYVSFAIHYYSLIVMKEQNSERSEIIKKRAIEFAQTFKYWFDPSGEAVPFGRSLTYRFAQVAFWSALVVADIEALPWGEIKGIISRNLSTWFNHDIFTVDGRLSIGYHYENLMISEGYNGPGSPYWALKTFIILSTDESHPFWQAEAMALNLEKDTCLIKEARMLIKHSANEVVMFPAGQFLGTQNHGAAKYSKFAYSTKYGFSVPVSNYAYEEGGFDSTLALSEDDKFYRSKTETITFEALEDRVIHFWQPFNDVKVKTTVIPVGSGHIRIHELQADRNLYIREAGFSTEYRGRALKETFEQGMSYDGISIQNVLGYEEVELIVNAPNTHLFYPLAAMPILKSQMPVGSHLLISLVNEFLVKCEVTAKEVIIYLEEQTIKIPKLTIT